MVGALIAGTASDRLGRRRFLLISAVLFFVSSLGCAIPQNLIQFLVFRFIGGLAIGSVSIVSPLYISEIAPARIRGRAGLGQPDGHRHRHPDRPISSAGSSSAPAPSNWRWMFATGAAPAVVFFLLVLGVPESPRWLVKQGREERGRSTS